MCRKNAPFFNKFLAGNWAGLLGDCSLLQLFHLLFIPPAALQLGIAIPGG